MIDRFVWFKQSAYLWRGDGLRVYIDPWGVTAAEPADVIFITHAHSDHFSTDDIDRIRRSGTRLIAPRDVARELSGDVTPIRPGETIEVAGVTATAVPAYNVAEERLEHHPKAKDWVGYVLTLGEATYYHAGDTDHVPELDAVEANVAFLPVGGTYTMDPSEAAGLARTLLPQLAIPMHYGYAVGSPADAQQFVKEAKPVKVQILQPEHPFERS